MNKPKIYEWKYLGDGVYAMFDGFHIVLVTGSHQNPDDTIFLDPDVYAALVEFNESLDEPASS